MTHSRQDILTDSIHTSLQVTVDPGNADFILAHGTEAVGSPDGHPPHDTSLDDIRALLRRCAERKLPMIVANPDLVCVGQQRV
jgi:hypothetical protein